MPEGDSLHRIALRLRPLVGHVAAATAPDPRGSAVARAVDGRVLESVEAVGKHLLLRFAGGVTVRSHLGMNGRWSVVPAGAPVSGRPWLVLRGGAWQAVQRHGPVLSLDARSVSRLGPDLVADDVDVAALVARLRRSDQARRLGEALLDQRIVAGIGNIWRAEALWQARVSPWLPVGAATDAELAAALGWAREAMRASVRGAGTAREAYRRAGRPCRRCGTPIRARGLGDANRTAYWCPGCQRGPAVAP